MVASRVTVTLSTTVGQVINSASFTWPEMPTQEALAATLGIMARTLDSTADLAAVDPPADGEVAVDQGKPAPDWG